MRNTPPSKGVPTAKSHVTKPEQKTIPSLVTPSYRDHGYQRRCWKCYLPRRERLCHQSGSCTGHAPPSSDGPAPTGTGFPLSSASPTTTKLKTIRVRNKGGVCVLRGGAYHSNTVETTTDTQERKKRYRYVRSALEDCFTTQPVNNYRSKQQMYVNPYVFAPANTGRQRQQELEKNPRRKTVNLYGLYVAVVVNPQLSRQTTWRPHSRALTAGRPHQLRWRRGVCHPNGLAILQTRRSHKRKCTRCSRALQTTLTLRWYNCVVGLHVCVRVLSYCADSVCAFQYTVSERIYKTTRDITKKSKNVIFFLQRLKASGAPPYLPDSVEAAHLQQASEKLKVAEFPFVWMRAICLPPLTHCIRVGRWWRV